VSRRKRTRIRAAAQKVLAGVPMREDWTPAYKEAVTAEVQKMAEYAAAALAAMGERPHPGFLLPDGKRVFVTDTRSAALYDTVEYTPIKIPSSYTPKNGGRP
jgi:hypothetical protein